VIKIYYINSDDRILNNEKKYIDEYYLCQKNTTKSLKDFLKLIRYKHILLHAIKNKYDYIMIAEQNIQESSIDKLCYNSDIICIELRKAIIFSEKAQIHLLEKLENNINKTFHEIIYDVKNKLSFSNQRLEFFFVFIIPLHDFEKRTFDSIIEQNYDLWRGIIICNETVKNTVSEYLSKLNVLKKFVFTSEECDVKISNDEVCCTLYGGDWLFGNDALNYLNTIYINGHTSTFSSFFIYENNSIKNVGGISKFKPNKFFVTFLFGSTCEHPFYFGKIIYVFNKTRPLYITEQSYFGSVNYDSILVNVINF